jgi:Caspase domain
MKRRQFIQTTLQASSATLLLNTIAPHASTATSSRPPRQLALLVGVNDYSYGNSKSADTLKGCVNDVALLKNLLIYRYGFNPADIITLTDQQATREAILTNFENHLLTAQPNDTVVFAFSGHGTILADRYEKLGKVSTAILPYDHTIAPDGKVNYITGTTLFLLRSAFKTDNVTIILDCCYAGGGTRGDSTGRATDSAPGTKPIDLELQYQATLMRQLDLLDTTKLNQYRATQQGTKGVLLAAANVDQTSMDATFGSGYNAGAFTKFLTQTLWENPALPLDDVKQAVTEALIGFTGTNAQKPEFTYSPQQANQLKSQPIFGTSRALSSIPAQGTVLSINSAKREVTLWLGGVAPRSLDLDPGAEFRCLANQSIEKSSPIATLKASISKEFTAIATIPKNQPLPKPGDLLQHHYRPFPTDRNLQVGLDPSLNATTALLQGQSHLKTVTPKADGRFNGVDVILSQMTEEDRQRVPANQPPNKLPEIGSYGLFSSQREIIPGSFGKPGETLQQAVDRLDPVFKIALIKKLFGAMTVTGKELADKGIEAKVHLKGNPEKIIALPNKLKESAKVDQKLEVRLKNTTTQNLQSLLILISSNGDFIVNTPTNGDMTGNIEFRPTDIGTSAEILILVSPKPLSEIAKQIGELLNPSKSPSDQSSRSISSSQVDSLWAEFREDSGSRAAGGISPLVISLPIRVA